MKRIRPKRMIAVLTAAVLSLSALTLPAQGIDFLKMVPSEDFQEFRNEMDKIIAPNPPGQTFVDDLRNDAKNVLNGRTNEGIKAGIQLPFNFWFAYRRAANVEKEVKLLEGLQNAKQINLNSLKYLRNRVGMKSGTFKNFIAPKYFSLKNELKMIPEKIKDLKKTPVATPVDYAFNGIFGAIGLYEMTFEKPTVGYKHPTMEYLANYVRWLSNTESMVAPQYAIFFNIPEMIVTSETCVNLMNKATDNKFFNVLLWLPDKGIERANGGFQTLFYHGFWRWWDGDIVGEGEKAEDEMFKRWLEKVVKKKSKGASATANGINVYKPNIYLYPAEDTDFTAEFILPRLLTVSDPLYGSGWSGTAHPDGTLDIGGEKYDYLFYESLTDEKLCQTQEGFAVPADRREEVFREVLAGYGFNEKETEDFIDFWTNKLEAGCDYAMYPQLTEAVDASMPITVSPEPDSITRIWFAFEKNGTPASQAQPEPIERNGFTMVEWGGFFI